MGEGGETLQPPTTSAYEGIAMEDTSVDPELVQLQPGGEDPGLRGSIQRTAAPVPARAQLLQSIAESSVGEKLRGLRARVRRRNIAEDDADQQPADRVPEESVEATANPAVPRARSAGASAREVRLRKIIAEITEVSQPLERTPSARRDLAAAAQAQLADGVDPEGSDVKASIEQHAARNQRLRKQLRLIDAEIAERNADLERAELLRDDATTTTRYECDADCIVGGCGGQFAGREGVHCPDCNLFLCFPCFGNCVTNECQVGGRFDKAVTGEDGRVSETGSLPCALFPQMCSNGHISLRTIQRAMLHPANRGRDGAAEDLHSGGHSAHKIHLMARRRWAEAEAEATNREPTEDMSDADGGVALVRTFTERKERKHNATLARADVDLRTILAEKLDELDQLQTELARTPVVDCIPTHLRRRCALCSEDFAAFEGGECQYFSNRVERHSHFLCSLCFGAYIMQACIPGGVFEQEMQNESGTVASAKGQLPCPFFHLLQPQFSPKKVQRRFSGTCLPVSPQLAGLEPEPEPESEDDRHTTTSKLNDPMPQMECRCGAVPMSEIEAVLLDPRNNSYQYWRHRQPDVILDSHQNTDVALKPVDQEPDLPPGWTVERDEMSNQEIYFNSDTGEMLFERPSLNTGWSREAELLGRGFTPANVHETARLRVALAEKSAVAAELQALEETRKKTMDPGEIALAELKVQVIEALDRGGSVLCPRCGTRMVKDDACIHIDSCPCGSKWCFLCAQENCPRGGGGCDEVSYYLENHPGWNECNIGEESASRGAQQEFYRQRQAFMVRAVMEHTPPDLWARFREKHPDLLSDTPTPGRNIAWDSLESAEMPLFGANKARAEAENAADPGAAKRRLQRYWDRVRLEQEALVLRESRRWRHQLCCFPTATILVAVLVVGTHILFSHYPPANPALRMFYNESGTNSTLSLTGEDEELEREMELVRPANDTVNLTMPMALEPMIFDESRFPVQFLKWMPRALFVLGCTPIGVAAGLKHFGNRESDIEWIPLTIVSVVNLPLFWSIFVQGEEILESSWFVAYMWRPFCVLCNGMWVWLVTFVVVFATEMDEAVFVTCGCCLPTILMVVSIICTAVIRNTNELDDPCDKLTEAGAETGVADSVNADDCAPTDPTLFVCTWGCSFVLWYPRIVFLAGVFMMCLSLLFAIANVRIRHRRAELSVATFLGLISAGGFFWPATIDSVELLDFSWFTTYILAPFCSCLLGSGWFTMVCLATRAAVDEDADEDKIINIGMALSCVVFVLWEISMATFRAKNEEYVSARAHVDYEWTGAAYWLYWGPLSLLVLGALEMASAAGTVALGQDTQNNKFWFMGAMLTLSAIFPFWPTFLISVEKYVAASWMLAYYVLPACQAFWASAWFAVATAASAEQLMQRDLEEMVSERIFILLIASFGMANVVAYYAAMVVWRSSSSSESEAAVEGLVAIEYIYECTWPCIALRIFLSCGLALMGAAGALSVCSWQRDPVLQRCARVLLCFPLLIFLGLFALASLEAIYEWPIEMPLESLIRSSPVWNYCCASLLSAASALGSYKFLFSIMSDRYKLLSQMYDVPHIFVIASGTGAAWLTYVFRYSADPTFRNWEFSRRSRIVLWQLVAVCYWGPVFVAYCWKVRLLQQPSWNRSDSRRLLCRTLLFWLPCAAWPLILLAVGERQDDILNEVYGKCPLAFVGAAVSVGGFVYEVMRGCGCQCQHCARLFVAVTTSCTMLATNVWVLLGENCISLWWQGLREEMWFLLQDTCEAP